jgi:23S rRNA pseudouridine2605 synthase
MALERLQKILSRAGISSRRKAEELIEAGRVRVNGRVVTELGTRADPRRDGVEVDGRRITAEPRVYLVLNKPRGVVTTLHDPEGRPTVGALVRGAGARVVPVGRLDYHTSGVLLLTNDGELQSVLQHPSRGVPKVYVAKVQGVLDEARIERWGQSLVVEGKRTQPASVRLLRVEGDKTWIEVMLQEGKNRQVRRLGEAARTPVLRLSRLSFAGITVEGLRPGQWRHLTADELVSLQRAYGVPRRVRPHREPVQPARRGAFTAAPSPSRKTRPKQRSQGKAPARRPQAPGARRTR